MKNNIVKLTIFVFVLLLSFPVVYAQTQDEDNNINIPEKRYLELIDIEKAYKELEPKYVKIENECDELKNEQNQNLNQVKELQKDKDSINKELSQLREKELILNQQIEELRGDSINNAKLKFQIQERNKKIQKYDTLLAKVVANYLYYRNDKYTVDLALKVFNTISDETLKEKYNDRKNLLENYFDDANNFIGFLKNNGYNLDAANKNIQQKLKKQDFYKRYEDYNDWQTYLGII